VDPHQFRVISQSVKKTDSNDSRNPALYLAKGLLAEVRTKEKQQAQVASLTQTRDLAHEVAHELMHRDERASGSAAKAAFSLERSCLMSSMAPVLAIGYLSPRAVSGTAPAYQQGNRPEYPAKP
jgi:hypothetical protein